MKALGSIIPFFAVWACIVAVSIAYGPSPDAHAEKNEPAGAGEAVMCDFVCVANDDEKSTCDWTCWDPEVEAQCNNCTYKIVSGKATFHCTDCDTGTY